MSKVRFIFIRYIFMIYVNQQLAVSRMDTFVYMQNQPAPADAAPAALRAKAFRPY
jgi:hypothetical protein